MLPLCSAPLIALLVAGEVEDCSMVDRIMLGYHNISYLINASIYLVKGGRLGLMPGVLFHSCRPSFRHTGVMFPDFAFLTRLGDLWDPLDSSLWIKLLQQGPTLVLPFASPPPTFPLGVALSRVIFILAPPGQCLSKCWSELEPFAAPPQGNLRSGFSCTDCSSGVALRTRYVQLLSGCRRIRRSC